MKIRLSYSEIGSLDVIVANFKNTDDFADFLIDTFGEIIIRGIEKVENDENK